LLKISIYEDLNSEIELEYQISKDSQLKIESLPEEIKIVSNKFKKVDNEFLSDIMHIQTIKLKVDKIGKYSLNLKSNNTNDDSIIVFIEEKKL
jgi:hypothetical protein